MKKENPLSVTILNLMHFPEFCFFRKVHAYNFPTDYHFSSFKQYVRASNKNNYLFISVLRNCIIKGRLKYLALFSLSSVKMAVIKTSYLPRHRDNSF